MVVLFQGSAPAQIIPDNTLGDESSFVTPLDVQTDRIDGGAIRNTSLFHSFLDFNVDEGRGVYFANPTGISNILSRVTGDNASNLFGTLGVLGEANLFFINPNGIVFGTKASLDIKGSFLASTADSLSLADGNQFSATNPEAPPLLAIETPVPIGIEFEGGQSSSTTISNDGSLAVSQDLTLAAGNLDLQGQLLAGGDLTLRAQDTVQVRDSHTEPFVAAAGDQLFVQGNQQVDIAALSHPDSGLYAYGNLVLRAPQAVGGDAHFWSAGDFRVETLEGGIGDLYSPIDPIIRTFGDVEIGTYNGSSLHILAGGSVSIGQADITAPAPGTIGIDFLQETIQLSDGTFVDIDGGAQPTLDVRAGVAPESIGTPPLQIFIGFEATDQLVDENITTTPSSADIEINGTVAINAPDGLVLLTNQYQPNTIPDGTIQVERIDTTSDTGNGGDVILHSRSNIIIDSDIDSAMIDTSAVGVIVDAGNMILNAQTDVALDGGQLVSTSNAGNANNININSGALSVTNGGSLETRASENGNPGNVIIEALGEVSFDKSSSIITNGGNVILRSSDDIVFSNSLISSSALFTSDNSGNISLFSNGTILLANSKITSNNIVGDNATSGGNAGDININARSLQLIVGELNARTIGNGDAGSITIEALDSISFDQGDVISTVELPGEGLAGNINIVTGSIALTNQSSLRTSTSGQTVAGNNAGSITLNAREFISFDGQSSAVTQVEENGVGNGGNIDILTHSLRVANGSVLSAGTFGRGNAGNIMIDASEAVTVINNEAQLISATSGLGNAGNIAINADQSVSFLSSGAASSTVEAEGEGTGGNIIITTDDLSVADESSLRVSTVGSGNAGNIIIDANSSVFVIGGESTIQAQTSSQGNAGGIVIRTGELVVDKAAVSVSSFELESPNAREQLNIGIGDPGSLEITSRAIFLNDQGQLVAESASGENANITLQVSDLILLRRNSK